MAAWVYIVANRRRGTLYVGSTDNLGRRIWEHKQKLIPGFTTRYGVDRLVYSEAYDLLMDARHRERSMKRWRRAWKIELIESFNPEWRDLYFDLNK